MDSLSVLIQVVDSLRHSNPDERVLAKTAVKSLFTLASTLPEDPRGTKVTRVYNELKRFV
jgi:hypothetical protein